MMRRPNYAALIISVQGSYSGVVGATAMEAKMAKERTIPDRMRGLPPVLALANSRLDPCRISNG
jgi:hypothetical protein